MSSVNDAIAAGTIGGRVLFYSNYHCNLRCSYCLTESAPLVKRLCALAIGACGGDEEPTSSSADAPAAAQTTEGTTPAEGSSGGERCQDVTVPGH